MTLPCRLRVFDPSTLRELALERMAAPKPISSLRLAPVLFEQVREPQQHARHRRENDQQNADREKPVLPSMPLHRAAPPSGLWRVGAISQLSA